MIIPIKPVNLTSFDRTLITGQINGLYYSSGRPAVNLSISSA